MTESDIYPLLMLKINWQETPTMMTMANESLNESTNSNREKTKLYAHTKKNVDKKIWWIQENQYGIHALNHAIQRLKYSKWVEKKKSNNVIEKYFTILLLLLEKFRHFVRFSFFFFFVATILNVENSLRRNGGSVSKTSSNSIHCIVRTFVFFAGFNGFLFFFLLVLSFPKLKPLSSIPLYIVFSFFVLLFSLLYGKGFNIPFYRFLYTESKFSPFKCWMLYYCYYYYNIHFFLYLRFSLFWGGRFTCINICTYFEI